MVSNMLASFNVYCIRLDNCQSAREHIQYDATLCSAYVVLLSSVERSSCSHIQFMEIATFL